MFGEVIKRELFDQTNNSLALVSQTPNVSWECRSSQIATKFIYTSVSTILVSALFCSKEEY